MQPRFQGHRGRASRRQEEYRQEGCFVINVTMEPPLSRPLGLVLGKCGREYCPLLLRRRRKRWGQRKVACDDLVSRRKDRGRGTRAERGEAGGGRTPEEGGCWDAGKSPRRRPCGRNLCPGARSGSWGDAGGAPAEGTRAWGGEGCGGGAAPVAAWPRARWRVPRTFRLASSAPRSPTRRSPR